MITRVRYHFPRKYDLAFVARVKAIAAGPMNGPYTHDEMMDWLQKLEAKIEAERADSSSAPSKDSD